MVFSGIDWVNCWGEVFKIYRALGPGNIQSGDFVGIYYTKERQWLSLRAKEARRSACPGKPNTPFGEKSLVVCICQVNATILLLFRF